LVVFYVMSFFVLFVFAMCLVSHVACVSKPSIIDGIFGFI
jgi:hypothetical protein